ncbi:hypothetical protein Bca52824_086384 [Brassica carinata]|uniref:Uncharacterized protein n=1 Tax=Brassica carinata TaxID=52824 RepID=A0A8X7TNT3_BRACI|nr:hypothetical protein Bca52824_086384 [Brassica carinata]
MQPEITVSLSPFIYSLFAPLRDSDETRKKIKSFSSQAVSLCETLLLCIVKLNVTRKKKKEEEGVTALRAPSVAATAAHRRNDLRLLLGVMGAPLAPIHFSSSDPLPHLSIKTHLSRLHLRSTYSTVHRSFRRTEASELHQNAYAMGKLKMITSEIQTATRTVRNRNPSKAETGGFVLWQMNPDMWYVELSVGGNKVRAGCNGKLVWRHTLAWLSYR